MDSTLVRINTQTKTELENLKLVSNESIDSVIQRLMSPTKDYLSDELKKDLIEGVQDIQKGRVMTYKELLTRLKMNGTHIHRKIRKKPHKE